MQNFAQYKNLFVDTLEARFARESMQHVQAIITVLLLWTSLAQGAQRNWTDEVKVGERLMYDDPKQAIVFQRQLLKELDREKQTELWLQVAINLISSLAHNEQVEDAKIFLNEVNPIALGSTNPRWRIMILLQKGMMQAFEQQTVEARGSVRDALKLAEAHNEVLLEARALSQLAVYDARKNLDRDALENIAKANRLLRKQPMNNDVIAVLNSLTICFIVMGDSHLTRAVDLLRQLKRHAIDRKLRFLAHLAAYNLGDTHFLLDQYDESIQNYRDAARYAQLIQDKLSLAYSELGLGDVLRKKQRYPEARMALSHALAIFEPSGNKLKTYEARIALVQIALAEKKPELAWAEIQAVDSLQFDAELVEVRADYLNIRAKVKKAMGQFRAALTDMEDYVELKHSADLQREKEAAQKYAVQFELERKEQANVLLQQQNRIQELEIQRSERESIVKTLVLVGVGLVSALMFLDFIRVHRRNREISRLNQYIRINVLQRFLPTELVEEILAGRSRLDETVHNQTITILFADICEFTKISDRLDAETVATILNEFLMEMTEIVFSENGTIDKFIGDAIMVLFGAPTAMSYEEQAERAVNCARKMMDAMNTLNERWNHLLDQGLLIRIGIHQGPAVVGTFGGKKRSDYTVVGRAVNIASRVEGLANPGQIYMTESVAKHLNQIEMDYLGPQLLRGLQEPITIYRILLKPSDQEKCAS